MSIRGTKNYVFYVDQVLGSGSTGTVYFGRHKRKGDPCACKLFVRRESQTKDLIKENEIAFMRQLDHRNIVKFLAIEDDTRTKETVLVMELCTAGSLQKILSEPESAYGLPEEAFMDFFHQFIDGLSYLIVHGITHRDMKPGNILCSRDEQGQTIYKLTDFGATRDLDTAARANALYGTEEYLHPEIFRRVFIDKVAVGSDLEHNAEIWSVGITLYHVATGRLPFQAFGGRSNRQKMYEIISTKPRNFISGVQSTDKGEIKWEETLPRTCSLSANLQEKLVEVLRGIVQQKPADQWNFEKFIPFCENMFSNCKIFVFSAVSCASQIIYLPGNSRLTDLQNGLQRFTRIAVKNQIIFYNSKLLYDFVDSSSLVQALPATSEATPLFLLSDSDLDWQNSKLERPTLPDRPADDSQANLASDATWSRDASANCHRATVLNESLVNSQRLLLSYKLDLKMWLSSRYRSTREIFNNVKDPFDLLTSNSSLADKAYRRYEQFFREAFAAAAGKEHTAVWHRQAEELLASFAKTNSSLRPLCEATLKKIKDAAAFLTRLEDRMPVNIELFNPEMSVCEKERCIFKQRQRFQRSREIYVQFTEDKKRHMSYNDDQIHKYDRMKCGELLDNVIKDFNEHCISSTEQEHKKFCSWLRDWFFPCYRVLLTVEQTLEDVRSVTKKQTESLSEVNTAVAELKKKLVEQSRDSSSASSKRGLLSKIFGSFSGAVYLKSSSDKSSPTPSKSPASSGADEPVQLMSSQNASRMSGSDECIQISSDTSCAFESETFKELVSGVQEVNLLLEEVLQDFVTDDYSAG